MAGTEGKFQSALIKELKLRFPGCVVTKLDSGHIQGIPDLLILFGRRWATLECKRSEKAARRPNQEYYVNLLGAMGFSEFIFPENRDGVLQRLEDYFRG